MKRALFLIVLPLLMAACTNEEKTREVLDFTGNWKFHPGDTAVAYRPEFNDNGWRALNLPHDWSIESDFSEKNPATPGGGALPGGVGWYRKTFDVDEEDSTKTLYIDFDGVYRNSEVWINGKYLGKRPYGYSSFRYDMTHYIRFGGKNVIAVRVDNSKQPNSRWYSGSGIYRNVWLTKVNPIHVSHWGTYVTTPEVSEKNAIIDIRTDVENKTSEKSVVVVNQIIADHMGRSLVRFSKNLTIGPDTCMELEQKMDLKNPKLWNIDKPYLYRVITRLFIGGKKVDQYETPLGVRTFKFDVNEGFILNGKHIKINGVCNHQDLGALGSAVNVRAIERQLEILKKMGCNGIRCSHNPPAPELLDLCDKMGFVVMDEAFDMWVKSKTEFDYSNDFPVWYERDLTDLVLRDRNHPSVFIWSIGNEIGEQWYDSKKDSRSLQKIESILNVSKEASQIKLKSRDDHPYAMLTWLLADIVRKNDSTRPVTAACNVTSTQNHLLRSGALDMTGFNYHQGEFANVMDSFPNKPFIASESVSSLQTRGFYMMPSDSIRIWPEKWDKPFFNNLMKCSAYDNCHAPWGSTHEETWKVVKKYRHISGQFIWTGFDYLGEPTPYVWPSRSSYFGIIDLAGFPKDVYYMYQSEWTNKNVLHIFPHWNWEQDQIVDVWAYYNNADEVELFLNGKSLGIRKKAGDDLHVSWRVPFSPGTLMAVSRKDGKEVMTEGLRTAGRPARIRLTADRSKIKADGKDISFITVELLDKNGTVIPTANQHVLFTITGKARMVGTDNGDENEHASLKLPERSLFNGKCVVIVQSTKSSGEATLRAVVSGLQAQEIKIKTR